MGLGGRVALGGVRRCDEVYVCLRGWLSCVRDGLGLRDRVAVSVRVLIDELCTVQVPHCCVDSTVQYLPGGITTYYYSCT